MLQVHHTVASIISDDAKLLQCARLITWLEELASQSLDYTTEQGQGSHLQGVCCEPCVNAVPILMRVHSKSNHTFKRPLCLVCFLVTQLIACGLTVMPYACLHDSTHLC